MADKNPIGSKIRQLRNARHVSVRELAQQSQCSEVQIERLEAGELVPSLAPLLKIARGLGVRLGTLLDDHPHTGPVLARSAAPCPVTRFSGHGMPDGRSELDFFALAADKQDRHMEPFVIAVHPPETQDYPLSSHEGEEFLYVLSGAVEVLYGKDTHRLAPGDSIYYDSIVPHHVHAADGSEARLLAVVYTPA